MADAVEQRIAHPDVGRRHVDLRAERAGAVREFAVLHPREQVEIRSTLRLRTAFFALPTVIVVSSGVRSQTKLCLLD